jgi:hypothetical protein
MLSHPNYDFPFDVHTDASGIGLGGVLSQVINKQERVIQFISRTLHTAEKKLDVREREALAIVNAYENFRHYVFIIMFSGHAKSNDPDLQDLISRCLTGDNSRTQLFE